MRLRKGWSWWWRRDGSEGEATGGAELGSKAVDGTRVGPGDWAWDKGGDGTLWRYG